LEVFSFEKQYKTEKEIEEKMETSDTEKLSSVFLNFKRKKKKMKSDMLQTN